MNRAFMEAAVNLNNDYVREWKQAGNKIVGYTCSYVPDELFSAAGILPYRMRGFGATEATIGDTYFGPFICSLPKAMLQLAGEGRFDFLDGAIITPGCDSMRRLDECWRKAGEDIGGILPKFFFHFGVPHKFDVTVPIAGLAEFMATVPAVVRSVEAWDDDVRIVESVADVAGDVAAVELLLVGRGEPRSMLLLAEEIRSRFGGPVDLRVLYQGDELFVVSAR